ncbi:predicted protein [Streptomyces viridochromogenes DSM 40736]|uniref:Predicted protein n=1 Tax=Streptomyces viridochromogenes (strain DSM 40736 / JCM 4977 / BCRC 1201 / Tue 494) TaxID=591159 RepID=D9X5F6_STRVT|nr:predicted protein [Streptomyces viridochromogenes DSM 40736]
MRGFRGSSHGTSMVPRRTGATGYVRAGCGARPHGRAPIRLLSPGPCCRSAESSPDLSAAGGSAEPEPAGPGRLRAARAPGKAGGRAVIRRAVIRRAVIRRAWLRRRASPTVWPTGFGSVAGLRVPRAACAGQLVAPAAESDPPRRRKPTGHGSAAQHRGAPNGCRPSPTGFPANAVLTPPPHPHPTALARGARAAIANVWRLPRRARRRAAANSTTNASSPVTDRKHWVDPVTRSDHGVPYLTKGRGGAAVSGMMIRKSCGRSGGWDRRTRRSLVRFAPWDLCAIRSGRFPPPSTGVGGSYWCPWSPCWGC